MSGQAAVPFHQAVYAVLSADPALRALATGGIFDRVKSGAALPYVRLGEATATPIETMGRSGVRATLTIHTFAESTSGKKAAADVQARIWALLHNTRPAVAGFETVLVRCELSTVFEENDQAIPERRLQHGVDRYGTELWAA
ncbi:MAG TPA: DUF3168 domain-containing protein [Vicinamibacterales bacterium]|nr:DUF3168 domain-containing protein [Vicinamibacterales bacterium]